jgi:hypothetical protein
MFFAYGWQSGVAEGRTIACESVCSGEARWIESEGDPGAHCGCIMIDHVYAP